MIIINNANLSILTGVDEIFVEHVKRVFSADKFTVEQKPTQRLRCTTNGPRWEVDSTGMRVASKYLALVRIGVYDEVVCAVVIFTMIEIKVVTDMR